MRLNCVNCYSLAKMPTKTSINNTNNSLFKTKPVVFSGKSKETKAKAIPIGLQSKFQDVFHSMGKQVLIRSYFELKEEGFSDEQIAQKWFGEFGEEDDVKAEKERKMRDVEDVKQLIKDIDTSFAKVVPSLVPKTTTEVLVAKRKT